MKLVIKHLKKNFEKKEVLKDINFEFEKGKIYGLLGRNGAGKTTLFNCLNEDLDLDGGEFYINDGSDRNIKPEDIGYVLSTPNVPEFLTGREFLKFFIDINKEKIKNLKTIDEYFEFMKIEKEDRDRLLKDYSHGMKNKMQMLVNIIANPNILLLDEPLTSFDVVVAEEMKQMLKNINGGGKTFCCFIDGMPLMCVCFYNFAFCKKQYMAMKAFFFIINRRCCGFLGKRRGRFGCCR